MCVCVRVCVRVHACVHVCVYTHPSSAPCKFYCAWVCECADGADTDAFGCGMNFHHAALVITNMGHFLIKEKRVCS